MVMRWPGKIRAGRVANGIVSGLDWLPTFAAAAGYKGDIAADLRKGKKINGKEYKVHLDGFNQLDYLTGKGKSARNEIFYFAEADSRHLPKAFLLLDADVAHAKFFSSDASRCASAEGIENKIAGVCRSRHDSAS
jgi:hypothetical protein